MLFLYYTLRHNELSTDNGQTFDTMESFKEAKFHTSQVKNDWLKIYFNKKCAPNLDIVCRFTSSQLFGEEETFAALTSLLDGLHEVGLL